MTSQLSRTEKHEVKTLNQELIDIHNNSKNIVSQRIILETQINKLENLLNNNLIRKRDEIKSVTRKILFDDCVNKLKKEKKALEEISSKVKHEEQEIHLIANQIDSLLDQVCFNI